MTAQPGAETADRLALYRRAGRALERFFGRWTGPFCRRCLAVLRTALPDDPATDVVLVDGMFPGCCQAGVADNLRVPGDGEAGRFPGPLARAILRDRRGPPGEAGEFALRERATGRIVRGRGCRFLGPGGCALGELKAPLCLTFLCGPVRQAVETASGQPAPGPDTDDFVGSRAVLRAVAFAPVPEAAVAVEALEKRLVHLDRALARRFPDPEHLYRGWIPAGSGGPGQTRPTAPPFDPQESTRCPTEPATTRS